MIKPPKTGRNRKELRHLYKIIENKFNFLQENELWEFVNKKFDPEEWIDINEKAIEYSIKREKEVKKDLERLKSNKMYFETTTYNLQKFDLLAEIQKLQSERIKIKKKLNVGKPYACKIEKQLNKKKELCQIDLSGTSKWWEQKELPKEKNKALSTCGKIVVEILKTIFF